MLDLNHKDEVTKQNHLDQLLSIPGPEYQLMAFFAYLGQYSEKGIEIETETENLTQEQSENLRNDTGALPDSINTDKFGSETFISPYKAVTDPNQTMIESFVKQRRESNSHLTLNRFIKDELAFLEQFDQEIWKEYKAVLGSIERALEELKDKS